MADLRIVDAPEILLQDVEDGLKLPTGGFGNYAITMSTISDWLVRYKELALKGYVDSELYKKADKTDVVTSVNGSKGSVTITRDSIGVPTDDQIKEFVKKDEFIETWSGRSQEQKNKDFVHAKDVGLVANNPSFDNAPVFEAAFEALQGKALVLESGATYYTQRTAIITSKYTAMYTEGTPATIHNLSANAAVLEWTSNVKNSYTLTASATFTTRELTLNSVVGLQSGDIGAIISNKYWYNDARNQTYKSQLVRVAEILSGTTIALYDSLTDGYKLPDENVVFEVYEPKYVHLENFNVRCTPITDAVDNYPLAQGLRLRNVVDGIVKNVSTYDAQACGVLLWRCYMTIVNGGVSARCNAYQTGYGVQTSGTSHCTIQNRYVYGGRRGVDVSGIGVISTHTMVKNNVIVGGGRNSWGRRYGWESYPTFQVGAYQGGIGSHGAANHTTYDGNHIYNMHSPIAIRSSNETVINNRIYGRTRQGAISITYGGEVLVSNNVMSSGITRGTPMELGVFDGGGNLNSRVGDEFVRIQVDETPPSGKIVITKNIAEVQQSFCVVTGGSLTPNTGYVVITDNHVTHQTGAGDTPCYLISAESGAVVDLSNTKNTIINNVQNRFGGSGSVGIYPVGSTVSLDAQIGKGLALDNALSTTTYAAVANVRSLYGGALYLQRVGVVVTGSLLVKINPIAANTLTEFDVDVPFMADTFNSTAWAVGIAVAESGDDTGYITACTAKKSLRVTVKPKTTATGQTYYLNFTYRIR